MSTEVSFETMRVIKHFYLYFRCSSPPPVQCKDKKTKFQLPGSGAQKFRKGYRILLLQFYSFPDRALNLITKDNIFNKYFFCHKKPKWTCQCNYKVARIINNFDQKVVPNGSRKVTEFVFLGIFSVYGVVFDPKTKDWDFSVTWAPLLLNFDFILT